MSGRSAGAVSGHAAGERIGRWRRKFRQQIDRRGAKVIARQQGAY
jgi:hypothetical protein